MTAIYDDCEGNNRLWTGESAYCQCTHHIIEHGPKIPTIAELLSGMELRYGCAKCRECKGFKPYSKFGTGVIDV